MPKIDERCSEALQRCQFRFVNDDTPAISEGFPEQILLVRADSFLFLTNVAELKCCSNLVSSLIHWSITLLFTRPMQLLKKSQLTQLMITSSSS